MSPSELWKSFIEKYEVIAGLYQKFDTQKNILEFLEFTSTENAGPFAFTQALFLPAIMLLGDDDQLAHYKHLCFDNRIITSYAQTEVSHGSDVQGLETIATYDKAKKVFTLNTPSNGAIKYWPGGMGHFCTHLVS